uniref:Uncharacterized protein n=1 Tax=Alexandrium andersonii TaxID=327968 RepID=A0A7S2IR45_9DINO
MRSVRENKNNVHLENRLTTDLGKHVGLDAVDVRRAELDEHARDRFPRLRGSQAAAAAARCRQLFDVEALLGALAAEIGGLAEDSSAESFPRAFLTWASEHMTDQHVLLDEETFSRIEVEQPLALAILETLFLGRPRAAAGELYRDKELQGLFR